MNTLSYRNEDDKAYGLAGMMYSLGCVDAIDSVAEITIDTDGPMVTFSHEFYFTGSPTLSAKASWDNMLRNFHITSLMALSNLLSRSMVRDRENPPQELLSDIFDTIREEGLESCSLEEDEVKTLYDNTLHYALRLFGNPRVHPAIHDLSRTIALHRRLTGRELRERLEYLRLL